MRKEIKALINLKPGDRVTKEIIHSTNQLLNILETVEENCVNLQNKLTEAENELCNNYQINADCYNQQIEQNKQHEDTHFKDINNTYLNEYDGTGIF